MLEERELEKRMQNVVTWRQWHTVIVATVVTILIEVDQSLFMVHIHQSYGLLCNLQNDIMKSLSNKSRLKAHIHCAF